MFDKKVRHTKCQCVTEHLVYNQCLHKAKGVTRWMMLIYGLDEFVSASRPDEGLRADAPISNLFDRYEDRRDEITALQLQRFDHIKPDDPWLNHSIYSPTTTTPAYAKFWKRWFYNDIPIPYPNFNRALIVNTDKAQQVTTHQACGFNPIQDEEVEEISADLMGWKMVHFFHMMSNRRFTYRGDF